MNLPPADTHTCYNCFAEFEWTPFTSDGENFCCAGCAEGGPCVCTYTGAPHVIAPSGAGAASEPDPGDVGLPAAESPGGPGPDDGEGGDGEPPKEPPAPGQTPDEEPPVNGRLAIIMAAVSEMPLPVQEVVRARLATAGSEDQVGEPLGLTGEEVRQLLRQGQAILDRSLGPGFTIRYIAAEQMSNGEEPEQAFPPFEQVGEQVGEQAGPGANPRPGPATGEQPTDLGLLIARSVDSMTRATGGDGPENEAARDVLAEALREAGNLFRLASERLNAGTPPATPLRSALAEVRGEEEPVTLIVENPGEIGTLILALQSAESVQLTRLQSISRDRAVFRLAIGSMMGLVRDLMSLEGTLRPTRLQMSGEEITVSLPARARPSATGVAAQLAVPRFELSVDSFFGARHFVGSATSPGLPHHHSYRVEASFVSSEPDRHGFVIGFASVRELVESTVMEYSERLLNTAEPFGEIPPTTENLAKVFHEKINVKLRELDQPGVRLKHVRVWESPSNSATYTNFDAGPGPDFETGFGADASITA